jgi:hypothetical protein
MSFTPPPLTPEEIEALDFKRRKHALKETLYSSGALKRLPKNVLHPPKRILRNELDDLMRDKEEFDGTFEDDMPWFDASQVSHKPNIRYSIPLSPAMTQKRRKDVTAMNALLPLPREDIPVVTMDHFKGITELELLFFNNLLQDLHIYDPKDEPDGEYAIDNMRRHFHNAEVLFQEMNKIYGPNTYNMFMFWVYRGFVYYNRQIADDFTRERMTPEQFFAMLIRKYLKS